MTASASWLRPERGIVLKAVVMIALLLLVFQLDYRWTRMFHIVAGFVWYAMLLFLVIVFLPVVDRFSEQTVCEIVGHIVPRVFHTVTVAGFFAVGVGWYNAYLLSNGRLTYFYHSPLSLLFTVTISIVTLMYLFHLFLESSEINVSSAVARGEIGVESEEYQLLIKGLRITPRIGFAIISFAIFVMFLHN